MIGSALKRRGYHVELAPSGREAVETLERDAFDLMLTDIEMEDGNGIVLLEYIHERVPDLPVVMVTASDDIGVAIDSMRRGAFDYLLKPFDLSACSQPCSAPLTTAKRFTKAILIRTDWSLPLGRGPKYCAGPLKTWSILTT